jgi:hypothetical protein
MDTLGHSGEGSWMKLSFDLASHEVRKNKNRGMIQMQSAPA